MSTKMMMSVVSGAILMGLAASSEAATVYDFPTGRSFPTNPTGQWSLYTGPQSWSKVSDLTLAVNGGSNGGGQVWQDSVSTREPIYNWWGSNDWTISEQPAWSRAAVLVFDCPQTGTYSLDFQVYTLVSQYFHANTETLKLATSTSDAAAAQVLWSNTHAVAGGGQEYYDNLSVESALQNISLAAGNKIILSMNLDAYGDYTQIRTFLLPVGADTNGNIQFTPVPEPAALSLLTLGGLALLRRRRS